MLKRHRRNNVFSNANGGEGTTARCTVGGLVFLRGEHSTHDCSSDAVRLHRTRAQRAIASTNLYRNASNHNLAKNSSKKERCSMLVQESPIRIVKPRREPFPFSSQIEVKRGKENECEHRHATRGETSSRLKRRGSCKRRRSG